MTRSPQIRLLPDGRRLHLQDGPIDLVIRGWGDAGTVRRAYDAAAARFTGLLDELCDELPALRHAAGPEAPQLAGPIARRMAEAVAPFAAQTFITPMAAVAGAVAEAVLAAMTAQGGLTRAFVNNGGDIALHCAPGQRLTAGLVGHPDVPAMFGRVTVEGEGPVRGIATSGWRGRSFSLGIADSVTILARGAGVADAAATIIANAVDLPGHPGVTRVAAASLQPDSDLGHRLVTRAVSPLTRREIEAALDAGLDRADVLIARGSILGAALQVQGIVRTTGVPAAADSRPRVTCWRSTPSTAPSTAPWGALSPSAGAGHPHGSISPHA